MDLVAPHLAPTQNKQAISRLWITPPPFFDCRFFLFMIAKANQAAPYTTWEGAKEAITPSTGMVHRVSGCSVRLLRESWAHYSTHGEVLVDGSPRRGNAPVALVVEDCPCASCRRNTNYAEVDALDEVHRDVTRGNSTKFPSPRMDPAERPTDPGRRS